MGNIDRYPTYKGVKVTEVVLYANYIGLCRYVVNISRWSPYEGGQLDRFHCIWLLILSSYSVVLQHFEFQRLYSFKSDVVIIVNDI